MSLSKNTHKSSTNSRHNNKTETTKTYPTTTTTPTYIASKKPTHDEIAKRAYMLHLSNKTRSAHDNWIQAERELTATTTKKQ